MQCCLCVCVHVCCVDSFHENFKSEVSDFFRDNYGKLYFHGNRSISSKYLYRTTQNDLNNIELFSSS